MGRQNQRPRRNSLWEKKGVTAPLLLLALLLGLFFGNSRVEAAGSYKVVYHLSFGQSTKTVVKRAACGKKHTILSGKAAGFTQKGKMLVAWTARRQPTNRWAIRKGNSYSWGRYNNRLLRYFKAGDHLQGNYKNGDQIHLYGYWVDLNNVDVTLPPFGANGKDKTSDTQAIQRALNLAEKTSQAVTVVIPAGTYYLNKAIKFHSNTTVKLAKKATIRRTASFRKGCMLQVGYAAGVKNSVGGYRQEHDITIDGGTWIGDPAGSYSDAAIMRIHHSDRITLKNGVCKGYSSKHAVIFVGVDHITVDSMTFRDHKLTRGSSFYSLCQTKPASAKNGEAIHTDFAGKLDAALPYDGTICDHVRIQNCLFLNVYSGIGSHIETAVRGSSYVVCHNTFKNVKNNCMNMYSKDNVEIYGNKVTNCGAFLADKNSNYLVLEEPVNASGRVSAVIRKYED